MTADVYITMPMTDQSISHTWRTTIQENIKGAEKRSALLTWPRIKLINKINLSDDARRSFIRANFLMNIFGIWAFPIISDKAFVTSQASSGQKIITLNETDYRHFYEGRECVLIDPDDWESYEVGIIDTIDSSTQITLLNNLSATWGTETLIYPLYECRITQEQEFSSKFRRLSSISIEAEESFESLRSFTYALPTIDETVFPIYNELNLFLKCPRPPIDETYRDPYVLFGGIGKKQPFSTYEAARILFNRNFQFSTKKDIYDILDFFDAKQGRFGSFYTPTWIEDIVISSAFNSADTTLDTKKIFLSDEKITGEHIYIKFPDGSYTTKEITERPSPISIIIDSAIGTTISSEQLPFVKVSFLYEVRFNLDEIELKYQQKKKEIAKIGLTYSKLTPNQVTTTSYVAKSIILDIADNWGDIFAIDIRSIDFWFESSKLTIGSGDITCYTTSSVSQYYEPWRAFDTSLSKTGTSFQKAWQQASNLTNQRLICVFDTAIEFDEIRINNGHWAGTETDAGVENVVINVSSDEITDTTYGAAISNATEIYDSTFDEHTASDVEDEQTLDIGL